MPIFDPFDQKPSAQPATPKIHDPFAADTGSDITGAGSEPEYLASFQPPPKPEPAKPEVSRSGTAVGQFLRGAGSVVSSIPKSVALGQAGDKDMAQTVLSAMDRIDAGEDVSYSEGLPIQRVYTSYLIPYKNASQKQRQEMRAQFQGIEQRAYPDPRTNPLFKAGEAIDEVVAGLKDVNPKYAEEFWAGKLPQGVGSTFGFLLAAPAGPVGIAGAGAMAGSVESFEDAINSNASVSDALSASGWGALVGTSEAVPITRALDKLDRMTGGGVKRTIASMVKQGTEEAIQEAFQQISKNLVARDVVGYDPNRNWYQGAGEGAAVGFGSGALMDFLFTVAAGGRRGKQPAHSADEYARQAKQDHGIYDPFEQKALPAPVIDVTPEGVASTAAQRQDFGMEDIAEAEIGRAPLPPSPVVQPKSEQRATAPVAESQAPAPSEPGEGGVATAPAGGAPSSAQHAMPDGTVMPGVTHEEATAKSGEVSTSLVDQAAAEAATSPQNNLTEPTEAQKESGRYKKGHVNLHGLNIAIENPAGTKRRPEWPALKNHYGYIKRTEGKDGDAVDVFLGPKAEDAKAPVFVVDQINPETGKYDEAKVLLGFENEQAAREGYAANYSPDWKGLGAIKQFTLPEFKLWLKHGNTKKPVAYNPVLKNAATVAKTATPVQEKPAFTNNGQTKSVYKGAEDRKPTVPKSELDYVNRRINELEARKKHTQSTANELRMLREQRDSMTAKADERTESVDKNVDTSAQVSTSKAVPKEGTTEPKKGTPEAPKVTPEEKTDTQDVAKKATIETEKATAAEPIKKDETTEAVKTVADAVKEVTGAVKELKAEVAELRKKPDEKPKAEVKQKEEPKAEKPKTESKPKAEKQKPDAKPDKKIGETYGEELTYNARNRMGRGITWSDVESMNDSLKTKEVVKSKAWPRPDYQALVDEGMPELTAHIVKQVYDAIATSPQVRGTPTDADMKNYLAGISRVRDAVFAWADDRDAQKQFADSILKIAGAAAGRSTIDMMSLTKSATSLRERAFPDGLVTGAKEELMAIGGRKVLDVLSPGYNEAMRAAKDTSKGWPGKQEAWKRQGIKIVEKATAAKITEERNYAKDGKTFTTSYNVEIDRGWARDRSFGAREEAQTYIDNLKPFLLVDKYRKLLGQFDNRESAAEAARELTKREGGKVIDRRIEFSETTRKGPAHRRPNENITPDRLRETFGFRGVNFGNWTNQKERQAYVNAAYDALHDLAQVIGVPPKAISLNGLLGLAFGAQGNGKAAAHFVPGVNEINLTRTSGAGALAHEWGHALDHYFAVQAGHARSKEPFMTSHRKAQPGTDIRPEIVDAFKAIYETMTKRPMTEAEAKVAVGERAAKAKNQLARWIKAIRRDLEANVKAAEKGWALEDFDQLGERLLRGDVGDGYVKTGPQSYLTQVTAQIRELYKDATGQTPIADNMKGLDANATYYKTVLSKQADDKVHVPQQTSTDYFKEASNLNKEATGMGKAYWTEPTELFARAWETYVLDQLAAEARVNDYLTHPLKDNQPAYPQGQERTAINKAFDKLIETVETKETENGVALFSRAKRDQTETPEFKKWFGDSKVVDENGKPLVVYHGSSSKFDVFDIAKLNNRNEGPGFYFTTDKEVASGYVNRVGNDGQMVEAYLSIRKPLSYSEKPFKGATLQKLVTRISEIEAIAEGIDQKDGFLSNFSDTYTKGVHGAVREAAKLIADDETAVDQISGIVGSGVSAKYVLQAVTEVTGYDGIVSVGFSNEGTTSNTIYVAFRPEQIKSAIGNRGTFDPNDPSILYSRARPITKDDSLPSTVFTLLAQNDDAFQLPESDAKSMQEIAADVFPDIKVEEWGRDVAREFNLRGNKAWTFTLTHKGAKQTATAVELPDGEIYLNISEFKKGGGGNRVYAVVANYARNNGKVFIGDPYGLSPEAVLRRTSNMVSTALKFGTTDHIRPHNDQIEGSLELGIPPLDWEEGNTARNINSLLQAESYAVMHAVPEARRLVYNFDHEQFEYTDGQPASRTDIEKLAERARLRGATVGIATVKRAVLVQSALSPEVSSEGGRPGVLAKLAELAGRADLKDAQLDGILYSRRTVDTGPNAFPVNEANRDKTNRLAERILITQGERFTITPVSVPDDSASGRGARRDDAGGGAASDFRLAETLAGVFGKEVVWIRADGQFAINGVVVPGGSLSKYVFIDVRADHPAHVVLGHELSHHLEADQPALYRELLNTVEPLLKDHARYRMLSGISPGMRHDSIVKEMVGDLMGDAFADPSFWNQVGERNPSLLKRLADAITSWINQLLGKIGKAGLGSSQFVTDLEAARRAIADAVARYAESGATGGTVLQPAFSTEQREIGPTFYSQMERTIEHKLPNSGTPEQFKQAIESWAQQGQFKQEELEWSGLSEWLDEQTDKLSKQQVLDFIRANQVEVKEVTLGAKPRNLSDVDVADVMAHHDLSDDTWEGMPRQEQNTYIRSYLDASEIKSDAKFESYQLPGGENYREVLLTLPSKEKEWIKKKAEASVAGKEAMRLFQAYGQNDARTQAAMNEEKLLWNEAKAMMPDAIGFRSPHFDEPNILAHVRFNERTDADGKRVLFIEEVQSDWHQQGRKKGYGKSTVPAGWANTADATSGDKVPDAPFKTTWPLLAMKRMIRYAAENGFDRIAWTTGEQQAARYELSKQIDSLDFFKRENGLYKIVAHKDGSRILEKDGLTEKELEDHVGKDISKKIVERSSKFVVDEGDTLSGLDLKVGGEGMKAFYDQMLPSIVNKYVKKWGGKVGEVNIVTAPEKEFTDGQVLPAETKSAHSIDITPAMRDAALAGQPLFSRKKTHFGDLTSEQEQALKNTGGIVEKRTIGEWWGDTKPRLSTKLAQAIADQFAPLKELDQHAYLLARMSKASDGALEALLQFGNLHLEGGVTDTRVGQKGFIESLQSLQGEQHRFFWWVAAHRAEGLAQQDKEHLFGEADIKALKTLNRGKLPDGKNREAVYLETLRDYTRASKNVLDIAEQSGIIDGESRQVWEKEMYVPFYRALEDGFSGPAFGKKSGLVRQYAFKKLKGGTDKLHQDLLANVLLNWSHLLSAAAKNRAARAALPAAEQAGVAQAIPAEQKGAVYYLDGGKKRWYVVDDPLVLDAITSLEFAGFSGPAMKALSKFKHYLTIGVTANPAFKIRNLMRDSIAAIGTTELGYNPLANVGEGVRAMAEKGQTYASLLASGGIIRFGTMLEGNRATHVDKLINAGVDANTIIDTKEKALDMLQKAWDWYNEMGDISEGANRAALYQQLRAKGVSHAEAALEARDLLDFSMQGTSKAIRFLVQTVVFFNARTQGLYKLWRAGKVNPRRLGAVLGATALFSIALMLAYKDDEDWKRREDWDRDNYWWFKIGGVAFRIPKPFEIGVIATLAERSVELFVDAEMTAERFYERLKFALGQTMAFNPTPQLFKPVIDIYANEDSFTGRSIEGPGLEKLPKSERYTSRTSETAKLAGNVTGAIGLSPAQLDHLIRGYFGWLGTAATTSLDMMITPLSDQPVAPEGKLKDWFLVGNFVETLPAGTSRYVTTFYNQAKEIEETYADFQNRKKVGRIADAKELLAEERATLKKHGVAVDAKKAMSNINRRIQKIENRTNLTASEKRIAIDELMMKKENTAKRALQKFQ